MHGQAAVAGLLALMLTVSSGPVLASARSKATGGTEFWPHEALQVDAPQAPDDGSLLSPDEIFFQRGGASWYGLQFHGRRTASGERFNLNAYTAAHRRLPFGTKVCVHSLVTGKEVLVRINDRGPHTPGRIIDLSRAAAQALGLLGEGIKQVALSLPELTGRACGPEPVPAGD